MQILLLYYLLSKSKRSLEKINFSSNNSSSIENHLENQILKILMKSGKKLEVSYEMESIFAVLQPIQCGEPWLQRRENALLLNQLSIKFKAIQKMSSTKFSWGSS